MYRKLGILALLLCFAPAAHAQNKPEAFTFKVKHKRMLRDETGTLIITRQGINFRPDRGGDDKNWAYEAIRQITVVNPKRIEVETYENRKRDLTRHRDYQFELLDGAVGPELSTLLVDRSARPLVTSVMPGSDGSAVFQINVKHLHTLGGCEGVLQIYANHIVYQSSDRKSDSRFWRYSDIQNFGLIDRYRLGFTTYENSAGGLKEYNFELRRDLPEGAYDYVWKRIHPTAFSRLERP